MTANEAVRVWVLLGPKAGDNAQMLILAESLRARHGIPFTTKQLQFHSLELLTNLLLRVTLLGLIRRRSEPLTAPWPDLIITSGRRNEPVARWIQRQHSARLVHLGRPWSRQDRFDLVLTTPQYQLQPSATVMTLSLPLARANEFSTQPKVRAKKQLALLVGGDSGAQRLTAARARQLASYVLCLAERGSAELVVTTSGRTQRAATNELRQRLPMARVFFDWQQDPRPQNPYRDFLANSDAFVVTSDSASLLADACATGKPVYVFDLQRPRAGISELLRYRPLVHLLAQRIAPKHLRRDIRKLHRALLTDRRIQMLDEQSQWPSGTVQPDQHLQGAHVELVAATDRVAALLQAV